MRYLKHAQKSNIEIEFKVGNKLFHKDCIQWIKSKSTINDLIQDCFPRMIAAVTIQTGNGNLISHQDFLVKNLERDQNEVKRLIVIFDEKSNEKEDSKENKIFSILRQTVGYKIPIFIPFVLACIWIGSYQPKENNEICFSNIGCFSLSHPWSERPVIFNFVPQSPTIINVKFYAHSRMLESVKQITRSSLNSISLNWNTINSIIFIIHGYMDDSSTWMQNITQTLLIQLNDAIIINVDWRMGARMYYPQVVANTRIVASEISLLLRNMQNKGIKLNNVHIIGHSLASHIAAYVGKTLPGIGKITALDPAFPLFDGYHEDVKLTKNDASIVIVFHSNIGPFGFGLRDPLGTVDIYINDGQDQPGCNPMKELMQEPLAIEGISEIQNKVACSHRRGYEVFEEILKSKENFFVYGCESLESIRDGSCKSKRGSMLKLNNLLDRNVDEASTLLNNIYYMPTQATRPFYY